MIGKNGIMLKSLLSKHVARNVLTKQIRFDSNWSSNKIGSREIVGFGMNGEPTYNDWVMFPFPAVRFREITPDLKALREKEKGDWKSLTLEEKKCLYRVSFCQTLEETMAPTGEWKSVIGLGLIAISLGVWLHLLVTYITQDPKGLPASFDKERQQAQLKRMIDLRMNPITGISSKWDYEKGTWK